MQERIPLNTYGARTIAIVLLTTAMLLGQTASVRNQLNTFRVRGRITDRMGLVLPGTTVVFNGKGSSKHLIVDKSGSYQTDLPFGDYSMTAEGPEPYAKLGKYERPTFRVISPTTVILNGTLPSESHSCDISGMPEDPIEQENTIKSFCGGEDQFSIPRKGGASFRLYIRYSQRRALSDGGYIYSSQMLGSAGMPVSLFYNLFSIEAKQVTYDTERGVLEATGDVVVADGSGEDHHFAAVRFKLCEGEAVRED